MRIFSRVFFTLALLGGLAYGSYAFGAYVLSSRLFGNKGSKLNQNFGETSLPRAGTSKGASSASASVEILPESGTSGASRSSSSRISASDTVTDRSNQSGDDGSLSGGSDGIQSPSYRSGANEDANSNRRTRSGASTDTSTTDRPRKKRKRRKRVTPTPQTNTPREEPVRRNEAPEEESVDADVVIRGDNDSNFAPREEVAPRAERIEPRRETASEDSGGDSGAEERPRRRRRVRTPVEEPAPRVRERIRTRERIEPRRETPSRREESPVPRPEGGDDGGGGESPVPIPE